MNFEWDHDKAPEQRIIVEVTEEEYKADLESGLTDDEVLHPGRHVFRRGGFLEHHGKTLAQSPTEPAK